ncbi:MAG TPA: YceI family protein [Gaiellaceae bacterium]|jgi:hypothetical protein
MPIAPGRHVLGPENATLSVRTGRAGAAAMAGHDLLFHVTAWEAVLEVGDGSHPATVSLDADSTSLRVRQGTGGVQPLEDDDIASIEQTIDDEVLRGTGIAFRSTVVDVAADGKSLRVQGELTLAGATRALVFDVAVGADGELRGSTVLKQSDWGMKPYSALFGALKVADEVEVAIDASDTPGRPHAFVSPASRRSGIVDPGISSFLWAVLFFGYLVLGMAAVGVSWGAALVLSLAAAFFVFLFVRTQGTGRHVDEEQSR